MTVHHFVNCLALCFIPYYVYYVTSLKQLGSSLQYFYILGAYIVTALVRLLVEGIVFSEPSLARELFGTVLGMQARLLCCSLRGGFDLIALWFLLARRPSFLMIGFGWSFAESLTMRLVPIWIGARGPQFDYHYLQLGAYFVCWV